MERHGTRLGIKLPTPEHNVDSFSRLSDRKTPVFRLQETDLTSRWLQPCCFHHATLATTCAVTDLRQAQADSSRQMTAWRNNDWTFNCFIQSQKLLDIQVQTPYRLGTNPKLGTNPCSLRLGV